MRIGLVSTVTSSIRREAGGSVEAWTWLMARELARLGHCVTVFGCAGGEVEGESVEFIATLPGPYGENGSFDDWQLCEWFNLCRAAEHAPQVDLLHTQAYLWAIPLQSLCRTPMVHTVHIVADDNAAALWRTAPQSHVTALSHHQWSAYPDLRPAAVIPHGVDTEQFILRETPDDYLLYLGRFVSGKGPLQAIQIARELGIRLILAGPENPYFREKVKPLVDGRTVEFAGFVRGHERTQLLGGARALLYPLQYPEAFGLVLVEAMLCGTPVAALRLGAVPEIVEDGITGVMAETTAELTRIVPRCFTLDRRRIRRHAELAFSAARMAQDYARLYEKIAAR